MAKQKKTTGKTNTSTKKKPTGKSKGLGDTVEKFTKATGIKSLVGDCGGCAKRREKLNKLFPYIKDAKMTKDEASIYEKFRDSAKKALDKGRIDITVQRPLVLLFNKVYDPRPKMKVVTCGSCFAKVEDMILKLEEAYMNSKIEEEK